MFDTLIRIFVYSLEIRKNKNKHVFDTLTNRLIVVIGLFYNIGLDCLLRYKAQVF